MRLLNHLMSQREAVIRAAADHLERRWKDPRRSTGHRGDDHSAGGLEI